MKNKFPDRSFHSIASTLKQIQPLLGQITQASSLTELVEVMYEVLQRDFDFLSTGFYFINPRTKKLELLYAKGLTPDEIKKAEETAMDRHPGWVIKNKKLYISQNEQDDLKTDFQKRLQLVSRLYCPIIFKDECIGTIGVASNIPNAFTENHIAFIEFLCQISAITYENISHIEEINLSKERLNFSIDALKYGIWDWNFEKNILYWDDYMYSLFEIDKRNFSGAYDAFEKTLHPDDAKRVRQELDDCVKNKTNFKSEFRVLIPGGKMKRIAASGKSIFNNKGELVRMVGANWDITEVRENEVKLMQASKMSTLGEMSSGIAHEINNPLAIITGKVYKAKKALSENDFNREDVLNSLESIEKTTHRIVKIIQGLRSFSRDDSLDPFEIRPIRTLVEETLAFCSSRFSGKNIKIDWDDISPEIQFECRPSQIQQVLLNLLNNSFDAILELPEKWIRITVDETEKDVILEITDSGPGLPPYVKEKIFEPFFTTKPTGQGTGLGMSISHGIVKSHKGQLLIDEKNPHTCFKLIFPKSQK
jgi:signal transduction histidine kinase